MVRIGDVGVGGVEIIGYDTASQKYRSHFFDSQQPPDASLGGGHRDVQGLRDLGVGQPAGDQGQDLALPVGDAFQGRGGLPAGFRAAGELGDEPPGDAGAS